MCHEDFCFFTAPPAPALIPVIPVFDSKEGQKEDSLAHLRCGSSLHWAAPVPKNEMFLWRLEYNGAKERRVVKVYAGEMPHLQDHWAGVTVTRTQTQTAEILKFAEIDVSEQMILRRDFTGLSIWQGGVILVQFLLSKFKTSKGTLLELAGGTGLAGLSLAHLFARVLLTDGNAELLPLQQANIRENGFAHVDARQLEFGNLLQIKSILESYKTGFSTIISTDVFYSTRDELDGTIEEQHGLFETWLQTASALLTDGKEGTIYCAVDNRSGKDFSSHAAFYKRVVRPPFAPTLHHGKQSLGFLNLLGGLFALWFGGFL